jgi:hypothetical protein
MRERIRRLTGLRAHAAIRRTVGQRLAIDFGNADR